jgi:hypothetical protein
MKALIPLVFMCVALTCNAQSNISSTFKNSTDLNGKTESAQTKKHQRTHSYRLKALKMSRKKSNDLISIKAYRKSLQIKTKSVKAC